jgi:transmembrane sensor
MPVQDELQNLLEKQLEGWLTPTERSRFLYLLRQPQNRLILEDYLEKILHDKRYHDTSGMDKQALFNQVMQEASRKEATPSEAPVIPFYKKWLPHAAAILVVLSAGTWYLTRTNSKKQNIVAQQTPPAKDTLKAVNKVMLTLADGTQVAVDELSDGGIDNRLGADIRKQQGLLVFKPSAIKDGGYNTISTARGMQYHIMLPDKTEVWLNAASSLKFPLAFNEKERKVMLTGEGYFEVAKNAAQPFVVMANETKVRVLGTHFNVMSYDDEGSVRTTLLEGSVQLNQHKANVVLKPGEQGCLAANSTSFKISKPNLEQIMAWKNGEFRFVNTKIETIMRQVERWYDLDVVYSDDIPADLALSGVISRKEKVTQLLDILEATHKVRFSMQGNKVMVMPYQTN